MKKMFGFAVAGAATIGMTASADILYDNAPDYATTAHVSQEFDDFPDFSTYLVALVDFGTGRIINSVTSYMTNNGAWGSVTEARLVIFGGPGLPGGGDDPATSAIVRYEMTQCRCKSILVPLFTSRL